MSNEIAYRAWDPNHECMHYAPEDCSFDWLFELQDRHGASVMQFIGRLDRNDKRIYEGDIVAIYPDENHDPKHYGKRSVFVIEKDEEGAWGFEWHWKHLSGYECSTHIMEDDPINYEVIGNVHENPEILNAKRKVANA